MTLKDLIDLEDRIQAEGRRLKRKKLIKKYLSIILKAPLTLATKMKKLLRYLGILSALLIPAICTAAIIIPAESDEHTIIEATLEAQIPEGAEIKGGWIIPEGIDHREVTPTKLYLTGPSGERILGFSGYWILLGPEITVKDTSGVDHTFRPYLDSGASNEKAPFKIKGDSNPPNPPLPPPGGKYQIMFFVQEDNLDSLPQGQRELLTSLALRDRIKEGGHTLHPIIDDDQIKEGVPSMYAPWIQQVIGKPLPQMALAPLEGGPIQSFPLPEDIEALLDQLGRKEQ